MTIFEPLHCVQNSSFTVKIKNSQHCFDSYYYNNYSYRTNTITSSWQLFVLRESSHMTSEIWNILAIFDPPSAKCGILQAKLTASAFRNPLFFWHHMWTLPSLILYKRSFTYYVINFWPIFTPLPSVITFTVDPCYNNSVIIDDPLSLRDYVICERPHNGSLINSYYLNI